MQHIPLAIERLIVSIEHHQATGEYGRSYRGSKRLLETIEETELDAELLCRITIVTSKGAYYAGRFDESLSLLDRCRTALDRIATDRRLKFVVEAALVRANVLRRLGRYEEALLSLEVPEDGELTAERAEKLLIEGACLYYLHDTVAAEEALEVALGLATHISDSRIQSRVLMMKGLLDQSRGHLRSAEEYLARAKALCHARSDAYGEACAGLNMGIVLYRSGRFGEARESIERARLVFGRIGWLLGESRCLLARGNIDKFCRDFKRATRAHRKALKCSRAQGFIREQALALEFLGEIDAIRREYDKALEHYLESLRIAEGNGPARDIKAEVFRRLGELYVEWGKPGRALEYLDQALALSRKIRERLEEGAALRTMGAAYSLLGEPNRARLHFKKALEVLRAVGARFEIAKTHLYAVERLAMEEVDGSRNEPLAIRKLSDDRLDEAWSDLVEASHLFSESGSAYWKERTNKLLARLNLLRRHRVRAGDAFEAADSHVRLPHRREYLIYEDFVCISEPMHRVLAQARFSAGCARPVLITGETGTGKEVVARLIHSMSERAKRAFVAVNCAAIPDHLFETEFFGHRRGCFTGAVTDRKGLFEEADGGSLFLDEIGELTTLQQVKLLRVLQEKTIRRIGENIERPVDIRIVTATNQDLEEKMKQAAFRQDFFYRINAEQIYIPPLRERPEDIIPLITYYLCENGRSGRQFVLMEQEALKCLQRYRWPGNVRELFNLLERLQDLSNGEAIRREMLPERIRGNGGRCPENVAKRVVGGEEYAERLKKALTICRGNKSAAARFLGISRGTLYKDLKRSGLSEYIRDRRAS